MLARWFDRSGIGQFVAPDSEAESVSENDESSSHFWNLVAPDPKFTSSVPTIDSPTRFSSKDRNVFCKHCSKWTATDLVATQPGNTSKDSQVNCLSTPKQQKSMSSTDMISDVHDRVLSACIDTSNAMRSPPIEKNINGRFLRMCGSVTIMSDKVETKFRKLINKKPHLLRIRATNLGETAPDGYTSLQVTAYANHVAAAKIIFELEKEYRNKSRDNQYSELHLDRNMFGHTALHIAGERGNLEMVQLLLPYYQFPNPAFLIDLGKQTAFGRAVTSPNPKAKKNQRALERTLFSSNDISISGNPKAKEQRMGRVKSLKLDYGTSEMPGRRGTMEDAMATETWYDEVGDGSDVSAKRQEIALFAVCDGHGDNGVVSNFIASNVSRILRDCKRDTDKSISEDITPKDYWNKIWGLACLQLDDQLRKFDMVAGGSTAVFALVTENEIIVANVGDSRCILVCEKDEILTRTNVNADNANNDVDVDYIKIKNTGGQHENEPLEPPPQLINEVSIPSRDNAKLITVRALSNDHKPNLPDECERIQKAGFDVKDITFEEDGEKITIHKIVKNDKSQLAVSRAFGDFDFKSNNQLQACEQSVIPCAEVRVHERNPEEDLYLILACDGIWDVMTNEEVMDFVQQQSEIKSMESVDNILPDIADALLQQCLLNQSRDNMSCILIKLQSSINTTDLSSSSRLPRKALFE